ncbi:hypothetical protein ACGFNU_48975 [Spirillospora sp. NPDC048911]|uniref:hypothetical protein n=1 Tax=Spirillospora sp. NPDC048911 TaxID=3364527 RepID=UPI003711785D
MKSKVVLLPALFPVLAIAVLTMAGVVSWSNPADEGDVAIGRARTGAVIKLPELGKGKILPADQWPSACELVGERDVSAILPEAKEIEQEPALVGIKSIKEFAADPGWKESDRAEAGRCLYSARLPGETYSATRLWLRVQAVADPELIERYYETQTVSGTDTNQGAHGADQCAVTGLSEGDWICRKGPLLFSVGGQTTVAFKGKPAPAPFVWRDDVNPLVVETVAAKIG